MPFSDSKYVCKSCGYPAVSSGGPFRLIESPYNETLECPKCNGTEICKEEERDTYGIIEIQETKSTQFREDWITINAEAPLSMFNIIARRCLITTKDEALIQFETDEGKKTNYYFKLGSVIRLGEKKMYYTKSTLIKSEETDRFLIR